MGELEGRERVGVSGVVGRQDKGDLRRKRRGRMRFRFGGRYRMEYE